MLEGRARDRIPGSARTRDRVPESPGTRNRIPGSPGMGIGTRSPRTGARNLRGLETNDRDPGSLGTETREIINWGAR